MGANINEVSQITGISRDKLEINQNMIRCMGRVPRPVVLQTLQETDFTVLIRDASLRYAKAGFPTKVVESLMSGTPVICNLSSDLDEYLVDGENEERPVIEASLKNADGDPVFCSEKLVKHDEEGTYDGTALDVGTAAIYENVYYAITEGAELTVPLEHSAMVIEVIERAHAENPLSVKYL